MSIINRLRFHQRQKEWRKYNPHNSTDLAGRYPFDFKNVSVGNYTYGGLNILSFDREHNLRIGNFCSIGPDVMFVLSADHYSDHLSTFPYKVKVMGEDLEGVSKGDIILDDDVWIGYRATILSGVHIGQGAVVAAGVVVSKDVPPYAIVGGVPAKVIKYRFSPDVIKALLTIDYSKLTKELIKSHIDDLYKPLDGLSAEEVEKAIAWMPKKESKNTQS